MIALELEAIINNHHIEVSNDRLPVNATRAKRNRSLPPAFSWESGHLGRHFSGRDARAPRGE